MQLIVRDGQTRARAIEAIANLDYSKPKQVDISDYRRRRSLNANARYWAGVVTPIADHTGHTPEEIHEILKEQFCPAKEIELSGKQFMRKSTTALNVTEFMDYCTRCEVFAIELGVSF